MGLYCGGTLMDSSSARASAIAKCLFKLLINCQLIDSYSRCSSKRNTICHPRRNGRNMFALPNFAINLVGFDFFLLFAVSISILARSAADSDGCDSATFRSLSHFLFAQLHFPMHSDEYRWPYHALSIELRAQWIVQHRQNSKPPMMLKLNTYRLFLAIRGLCVCIQFILCASAICLCWTFNVFAQMRCNVKWAFIERIDVVTIRIIVVTGKVCIQLGHLASID